MSIIEQTAARNNCYCTDRKRATFLSFQPLVLVHRPFTSNFPYLRGGLMFTLRDPRSLDDPCWKCLVNYI